MEKEHIQAGAVTGVQDRDIILVDEERHHITIGIGLAGIAGVWRTCWIRSRRLSRQRSRLLLFIYPSSIQPRQRKKKMISGHCAYA
jgi:hypothetical protein